MTKKIINKISQTQSDLSKNTSSNELAKHKLVFVKLIFWKTIFSKNKATFYSSHASYSICHIFTYNSTKLAKTKK